MDKAELINSYTILAPKQQLGTTTSEVGMICDIVRNAKNNDILHILTLLEAFTEGKENEISWKNYIDQLKQKPAEEIVGILKNYHFYPHLIETPREYDSHSEFLEFKGYKSLIELDRIDKDELLKHCKTVNAKNFEETINRLESYVNENISSLNYEHYNKLVSFIAYLKKEERSVAINILQSTNLDPHLINYNQIGAYERFLTKEKHEKLPSEIHKKEIESKKAIAA